MKNERMYRELRAIAYSRAVRERRRMKASCIMLVIEICLVVFSLYLLFSVYGGVLFGR